MVPDRQYRPKRRQTVNAAAAPQLPLFNFLTTSYCQAE
jgi:hypothetical protein